MTYRLSIAGLFVATAYFGIGFAALRYPTQLWVCTTFTAAVAALVIAGINLAVLRGRPRAFWGGFLIAGAAYLVPYCIPPLRESVSTRLLTEPVLDLIYPIMAPPELPSNARGDWTEPDRFSENAAWVGSVRLVSPGAFRRVGHALATLLVAALGGLYALHLHDRRQAAGGPGGPPAP